MKRSFTNFLLSFGALVLLPFPMALFWSLLLSSLIHSISVGKIADWPMSFIGSHGPSPQDLDMLGIILFIQLLFGTVPLLLLWLYHSSLTGYLMTGIGVTLLSLCIMMHASNGSDGFDGLDHETMIVSVIFFILISAGYPCSFAMLKASVRCLYCKGKCEL